MVNREEWLNRAVKLLEDYVFWPVSMKMPEKWAISCGWVKGSSAQAVGVCVDPICTKDGTTHLFVVPTQEDGLSVLGTIAHEMIHAIVGVEHKHGGEFRKAAQSLEFSPKMASTGPVPGTPAYAAIEVVLGMLGPYPHAAIVPRRKPTKPHPWARWRSVKAKDYCVLANTKKIAEHGIPRDPWGFEMEPVDPSKIFGVVLDPRQKSLFELPKEPEDADDSPDDA
jgi:hypothetical protein